MDAERKDASHIVDVSRKMKSQAQGMLEDVSDIVDVSRKMNSIAQRMLEDLKAS